MKKSIIVFITILLINNASSTAMENEEFHVFFVERFPYHYRDGSTIKGLIATPADYAFKKSGFSYKWHEMPAIRQMVLLKENRQKIVMVGWFKNPEREQFAKFSVPVYQDKPNGFLFKKENERIRRIRSFYDLFSDKSLVLLIKEGYSYGQGIDNAIKKYGTRTFKTTVDNVGMVRMIDAGRCDYMVTAREETDYMIKEAGLDYSSLTVTTYPDAPRTEMRYLLFSKMVSDEEIQELNRYIVEYRSLQ